MTNGKDERLNAPDYDSEADKNQFTLEKNEYINPTEEQAMNANALSSDLNKYLEDNKSVEPYRYQPETHSNFDPQQSPTGSADINTANSLNSVGHLLRNARLAKKLSMEDVARQLRLSVQQIDAIEKEDYEKLPGRTFLRGFIRNYANLVQLDPLPLLRMLPESTRIISTHENTPFKNTQISFSSQRKNSKNNSLAIISIVFIVIIAIYFLFGNNLLNNELSNKDVASNAKIDAKTATVEIPLALSTVTKNEITLPAKQTTELDDSEKNQATPANAASGSESSIPTNNAEVKPSALEVDKPIGLPGDKDHLFFSFTADSWIKVVDGSGASLFEQLKKAGSEQIITGKKPFSIVIGNASGVNLTYNNKEIDISTYKKQDGTARFKLQ